MDQKLLYDGHIVGFLSPFRGQLIELMIDPDFVHYPRVATAMVDGKWIQDDMADMTPKLPPDEFREIMEWGNGCPTAQHDH